MRVVVVGGAGFVGLNVVEGLLTAGHDVVAFDRAPLPTAAEADFAALPGQLLALQGDVTDPAAVAAALGGAEAAVYGAAVTSNAATEAARPRDVLEVNLIGFLNVLEGARRHGLRRVVNLSSAGAYGDAAYGPSPLSEANTKAEPATLYGLSKYATERLGARLGSLWDLDVRSLRLSAVFGPWERPTGVRDTLSPPFQIMRHALLGSPVVLERRDVRDWLYAPDVAAAVQTLLAAARPAHDLYNVGLGRTYDLSDWAAALMPWFPSLTVRLAGPDEVPNVVTHAARARQPLDPRRLAADLGVRCAFGLTESIHHYAPWALAHAALLRGGDDPERP